MAGPPMKTRPCPPWLGVAATRSSATARSEAGADRFTFPSTPQRDDPLGTSAYHREARRALRRAAGLLGTPCAHWSKPTWRSWALGSAWSILSPPPGHVPASGVVPCTRSHTTLERQ